MADDAKKLASVILACHMRGERELALELIETIVKCADSRDKVVLIDALPLVSHVLPKEPMWNHLLTLSRELHCEVGETFLSNQSLAIAEDIFTFSQGYYFLSDKLGGERSYADIWGLIKFYRDHPDQRGVTLMIYDIGNVIKLVPDDEQPDFIRKFIYHPEREIRNEILGKLNTLSDALDILQFRPDIEQLRDAGKGPTYTIEAVLRRFDLDAGRTEQIRPSPVERARDYVRAASVAHMGH